jgi:signal peptidase II
MNRFWQMMVLMSFLIIADQLTKGWVQTHLIYGQPKPVIEGLFSLLYVHNTGAAFSFMADASRNVRIVMFLIIPTLFCGWIFWMLIKTLKGPFYMSLAYSLILAGAIGNLIDRYSLGYVVDFLFFYHKKWEFAVFNLADSCITIAAFLLGWDMLQQYKKQKSQDALAQTPDKPLV